MRKILLFILFGIAAWLCPQPQAEAQSSAISALAPMALQAAQTAAPMIGKWAGNVGYVFGKMGKDVIEIFLLPIGIGEMIFATPFGLRYFSQGLKLTGRGALAPFKLCFHTLLLPVAMCGIPVR